MRKLILIFTIATMLFSCGENQNKITIDSLIESKNIKELKARRVLIEQDLAKIDESLATLDIKTDEALVETMVINDTVFNHYLEIQGNVETKENILIQPEMPGALVSLNVKAGQRVSRGQILGRVDDGGMSQQMEQIQTQFELAKTTFERQKRLWDQKIGSEIQYLQAQTQMIGLQKSLGQMRSQIAKTLIKAPFSGVIDAVFVERGQIVAPSQQGLMRIVNLNNMYVTTSVPETYIGKLKIGTNVDASITSIGKTYKGRIRQVGNNINETNRSFGIEVSIPNPESLLRPNQVAKLKIIDYSNKSVVVVPTNVIKQDAEGNQFVFVAKNATKNEAVAKKAIIKTGQSGNNVTEILSGLKTGDRIVTEGANTISEGMKLNF